LVVMSESLSAAEAETSAGPDNRAIVAAVSSNARLYTVNLMLR
jgi:hypothetical protein